MLVSAVAEVDDRLIAEWDRSQNRTAAPLLEHGIGRSLYCSIKKPLVVQCLVARPPGPPYIGHYVVGVVAMDDASTFHYYFTEQHFYERKHLHNNSRDVETFLYVTNSLKFASLYVLRLFFL